MSDSLRPKEMIAVEALASGKSVSEVARTLGVNRRTVQRWQRTDAFRAAAARARERTVEAARVAATVDALTTLQMVEREIEEARGRLAAATVEKTKTSEGQLLARLLEIRARLRGEIGPDHNVNVGVAVNAGRQEMAQALLAEFGGDAAVRQRVARALLGRPADAGGAGAADQ